MRAPAVQELLPRSRSLLKKVFLGNNGIDSRYLALDTLDEAFDLSPDTLQRRFERFAPAVACEAARRALAAARLDPDVIDALLISTCTGYLCPGLTSYVIEELKLRPDTLALDLVGQGCGAAIPNLRTAEACLKTEGCERVLSICVEICSAAFYLDDDPGVLISACLFGDGAGAVALARDPVGNSRKVEWKAAASFTDPETRDLLRFETRDGLLRNILKPQVPQLASTYAEKVLDQVLGRAGVSRDQIAAWIWHAGGRDVLLALRDRLKLADEDLMLSARVLRTYGNISSPFVLHVLDEALNHGAPNGLWWLGTFGAGFSSHGALLQVEG